VVGARGSDSAVQAAQPAVVATNRLRCAHGPPMEWYAYRLIVLSYDGLLSSLRQELGHLSGWRRSQ
jgi:hypothetical protein